MSTVPVLMLGSDFQYAFAPRMGADSLSSAPASIMYLPKNPDGVSYPPVPAGYKVRTPREYQPGTGAAILDYVGVTATPDAKISTGENAKSIWDDVKSNIPNLINAGRDTIIAAIKARHPGMSDSDAAVVADQGSSLQSNMPWIILGGAALVAILFMAGTRKK